jgi:hypothetical protein
MGYGMAILGFHYGISFQVLSDYVKTDWREYRKTLLGKS